MSLKSARFAILATLIVSLGVTIVLFLRPSLAVSVLAPAISAWILRPDACRDYGEVVNGTYHKDLTHVFSTGFVIAFSATCIDPSQIATPIIGYSVFRREGTKFIFEGPIGSPLQPEQTLSFGGANGVGWSNITGTTASAVFHGLIHNPRVSSVEITLADGSAMATSGTAGRFVLATFLPIEPCILRSLDEYGVVLEEFALGMLDDVEASPAQGQAADYVSCK